MANFGTYPATAQAMLDRLITDRAFLVRTIVADNYPAVKANYDQAFGNGTYESTPEQLTQAILTSDGTVSPEVMDRILDVPFRNIAGSKVLRDAMDQAEQMVREAGGGAKNFITAGIGGLVAGVGNILNGRHVADAEARVQTQAITAQAITDQARNEQRERITRLAIISATIVAVIALLIIYRPR